ncbi:OmpH family outer membrane protein [Leeuwenhoekiella aequorea]|uniref:Periplasmic chaperone for outer membrane proteins Skp n=1 Tax=Leeuwenhoekiella aequorea TaxID=283736 RepID=A0A4Q0PAL6_9FLAO|nr:OmpH family outer membrane protein [Leeuwenhoekiella aequorea]RXG23685.1 periplasmic chaperone for outer membrane proteins Skp [Leeuwenhoekiella aequorea]
MKHLFLAFLVFISLSTVSVAQGTVAHIDMSELLKIMPESKQAEAEINRLNQAYRADFETSYREYQAKFVKFEDEASTLSPEESAKRKSDLELIERNLAQSQQNIDKQIAEKRELLFAPIREKAKTLVTKIADDQGFLYVLDSAASNGLIMAKGKDLMPEVKRILNIK